MRKGLEDHAALTSDKKNDFNVRVPPSSQISEEDICQCVSPMWQWLSALLVGILLQKASSAALPSTDTQS